MRKPLFFFILFITISLSSYSQGMTISGNVQDTISKAALQYSVAIAIRIKDSILIGYARTDAKGKFEMKNLPIDTVEVIISNPMFGDQTFYVFGSTSNYVFDFGKIILPPKSQQLKEVVIYAFKDPVYYKGDTLVYAADSFKVKPNATVEDLLRKLPGIKVDAKGKITSQGKEISEVLVDGDEFFGSDPTAATKNLAAKGVESVQVYEKKNENASDDKEETVQVMNLKLKDDAKKGYFGKVSGATDATQFYEGELLANRFKGSQKISVFSLLSNTPRSSLGWQDMYKYGLDNEMNYQTDEEGSTYWYGNNNQNQGIPQTFKSGFYYNDKIGKKTKINFNYTFSNNKLKANSATKSQYFLTDTNYVTSQESQSEQKSNGHVINMKIIQTLDSLTELTIEPKFRVNSSNQDNFLQTKFKTVSDTLSHETDVTNTNKASGYNVNTNLRIKRKFKNRDRLLLAMYNYTIDDNSSLGILKSYNTYYNMAQSNDSINQQKTNANTTQTQNANIIYTEPLTKKIKLEFDYNYNYSVGKQNKKTQKYLNGEYSVYDSSFTNSFENSKITNRVGLKFIFETKKISFNFGTRLRNVEITNSNLITQNNIHQSVNNVLPFLSYMYKFSQNSRMSFKYTTSSTQPSLNQLQPIPDNSNPNQVRLGNPYLLPTFTHGFTLQYNTYKPISGKYIWFSAHFNSMNDAFANSIVYDSLGRTISQTVNVNGNYNSGAYVGGGIPFFNKKLNLQPNANFSYNSYTGYINNQKNITTNFNPNVGMGVEIVLDTLSFSVSYNYDYSLPSSTLTTASSKSYSEQQFDASVNLKLPFKFLIETDASYRMNSQRAAGYNINYLLWNASISKTFLKNENFILTISGNDILNQNISTGRNIQDNVITDTKTNIISRYFLLKLTYKFNSTKTKYDENDM